MKLQFIPVLIPFILIFGVSKNCFSQCNITEYYYKFSNGQNNRINKLVPLNDGNSLLLGEVGPITASESMIMKLSQDGTIIWSFKVGAVNALNRLINGVETSDGGTAVIGQANLASGAVTFISKFNSSGNILWTKSYPSFSYNISHPASIIELTGGGFAVAAIYAAPFPQSGFVMRTDASGNIIWAKTYSTGAGFTSNANALVQAGNNLVITGFCETFTTSINHYRYLMNLQVNDGSLVSLKRWPNTSGDLFRTMDKTGDRLALSFISSGERIFWQTDQNGNNVQAIRHPGGGGSTVMADFSSTADTGVIYAEVGTSFNDIRLVKLKNNTLEFVKAIQLVPGDAATHLAIEQSISGNYLSAFTVTNSSNNNIQDIGFVSTPGNQVTGSTCSFAVAPYNLDPRTIAVENFSWTQFNNYTLAASTQSFSSVPLVFSTEVACTYGNVDPCTTLNLPASDTLCFSTATKRYTAVRSAGCTQPVQFQIDPGYAQVVATTDSTIDLKFLQTGSVKLYASLSTACNNLMDTVEIFVARHADSLYIGNDTSFCGQAQFNLFAGAGYVSYLWQDGSSAATISANNPGIYHLTVTDHCSNVFRDSLIITQLYAPAIELGPDRTICANDTIILNGPPGFNTYDWQPNIGMANNNIQSPQVFPSTTTKYYLYAETSPGCSSVDSIIVFVNNVQPINLPADSSICFGDTMRLTVPNSFSQYNWNTGQTSASIDVFQTGLYTIEAFDINGCRAKDSFRLINVFQNPSIDLGNDSSLCIFSTRILDAGAGAGFRYLWNDGSSMQTLQVADTGRYYVSVTDTNGCLAADSIHINKFLSAPFNFLPADTSICFPGSISISVDLNLQNLLWSTGSNAYNISFSQPGQYWLSATNNDGCVGVDSIRLSEITCTTNIYFPGAFTPNQDGINDFFKPGVFGNLINYNLSVYNRYGELVFRSKEPNQGWDGKVKGKMQNTGTFTWHCKYQFVDGKTEQQKGTIILIY